MLYICVHKEVPLLQVIDMMRDTRYRFAAFLLALLSWLCCATAYASGRIARSDAGIDTVLCRTVCPGLQELHMRVSYPDGRANNIFLLRLDTRQKQLAMRPFMGKDRTVELETIRQTMLRAREHGVQYVAGVNADFFSFETGESLGAMVVDGELVQTPLQLIDCYLAVSRSGNPSVVRLDQWRTLLTSGRDTLTLAAVNRSAVEDGAVLFTSQRGESTGTKARPELVLQPRRHRRLRLGKSVKCRPIGYSTSGSTAIPSGCFVVSGTEKDAPLLAEMVGRKSVTVSATAQCTQQSVGKIHQMVGGCPLLLAEGQKQDTSNTLSHVGQLHPRTAAGFDAKDKSLVLMVVDGRSDVSRGMTCDEVTDFLLLSGCTDALNLDGGGSSSLCVFPEGTRNVTSDGHDRAVANGIGIVREMKEK